MSITNSCDCHPRSIVSGQSIKCYDTSVAINEEVVGWVWIVTPGLAWTRHLSTPTIEIPVAYNNFTVGDGVTFSNSLTDPFVAGTVYYVVTVGSNYIELASAPGGSPITYTVAGTSLLYKASNKQFPILTPFPVITNTTGAVTLFVTGSTADPASSYVNFYIVSTALTKPLLSSTYKDVSIFIYNKTSATVLNRNFSANNHLIFTKLKFTEYITKMGIATFTVVNAGTATAVEKDLLLAGSDLTTDDNFIAIILGKNVVWSGRILRSSENKSGLFTNPVIQIWDIECESDLGRMRYQPIKTESKGNYSCPLGQIITALVTGDAPNINWNGTLDLGLRSNEGIKIQYTINDSDMLTQFNILSKLSDFDWRTRLVHQKYNYTSYNPSTWVVSVTSIAPYTTDSFLNKWVLFTSSSGIISYGKCNYNTTTTISVNPFVNPTLPTSTGTIIILGEPVLDIVSNLSTPSKVNTFIMNSQPSAYCNGYGFNDKTDRNTLATKIVTKGKCGGGVLTSSIAAVTPWDHELSKFEDTAIITYKTEGEITETYNITEGVDAGVYFTVDGWGYLWAINDYLTFKTADGAWNVPTVFTRIKNVREVYSGKRKVTEVKLLYTATTGWAYLKKGDLAILTDAGTPPTDPYDGFFYIDSRADLNYTDGMDIYIGGEVITTVDCTLDATYGYKIKYVANGDPKHRDVTSPTGAHGVGSIIWRGAIYDEASPVAGSPVDYHGVITNTYTTDTEVTYPLLEMYASLYIVAHSWYYKKATFWCLVNEWFKTAPKNLVESNTQTFIYPGDRILALQHEDDTELDLLYGQQENLWQVISYSFDGSTYKITVELGDFERNMFTQMADKTVALNQTLT